jgi:chaperonin GroEL
VALIRARDAVLEGFKLESHDEQLGVKIVYDALTTPASCIAENAGHDGALVVRKIRTGGEDAYGFDAATGEYGNLYELGIIDPAKVTRSALQNAASVATLLLSTQALVTDLSEAGDEDAHDHGEFGDEW